MFAFPHMARSCYFLAYAASWPTHVRPTGEGVAIYRRSFPTSCDSPCDLSVKPGLLGVCVSLTSTFQGQLFHHGFASARSYAPTTHRLPVQAMGLRASCPSSIPTACFAAHSSACALVLCWASSAPTVQTCLALPRCLLSRGRGILGPAPRGASVAVARLSLRETCGGGSRPCGSQRRRNPAGQRCTLPGDTAHASKPS